MKKMIRYFIVFVFLIVAADVHAQGENNIWTFGKWYSLDFNTSPPTLKDDLMLNNQLGGTQLEFIYRQSIAVSNSAGQLQFFVMMRRGGTAPGNIVTPNTPMIYDRNIQPVQGSQMMNTLPVNGAPLVIPHPGNDKQYYIFYVRNNGLLYSLFDMSLNNGMGNIVSGQHNILISGYNTVIGDRMTSVVGCNGVWLVIRNKDANGYKSFLVSRQGLNSVPVLSEAGTPTLGDYNSHGFLKASPNGRILATGVVKHQHITDSISGILELYDFEPCSGKLKNTRIIDTGGYIGVCFSPDNLKLYATRSVEHVILNLFRGYLFQFDLSLINIPAISASKTLIIQNPLAIEDIASCPHNPAVLGDIRLAPDGRLYLLNYHPPVCSGTGMAFHVIEQPNNVGLACQPIINAIYNAQNGMDYGAGFSTSPSDNPLPHDIKVYNGNPDTIIGQTFRLSACFADTFLINAQYGFECYTWDDETIAQAKVIREPGTYFVNYYADCNVIVDTYHISFFRLPQVPEVIYGCIGEISLKIENEAGNNSLFHYTLTNMETEHKQAASSSVGHTFRGLFSGNYTVRITNEEGCDTIMTVIAEAYPSPEIITTPTDTMIRYGDSVRLNVSGGTMYTWFPSASLDTTTVASPVAYPFKQTGYFVIGFNDFGCRDTGYINVDIDFTMPDFVPNAFSPNGDGVNDVFHIEGAHYQKVRAFNIHNRYGQLVFSTIDATKGWDGNYNGQACDVGTYYYHIQLDYPNGRTRICKGDIVLIR
ncbi:gliding motility-associated C-terminal domain-containing protein [Sphingobacterium sp. MYb388]|uniref:gliding motility-associated C-terminal domain-containing protein n=1 Tax=Sphingobacterium sp. MYb388 TaxID=2745437 RepID=UPI0030B09162